MSYQSSNKNSVNTPENIMNLLSHLEDVIVFLSPKNEITELNSAAEAYFQWNRATAIGANYIVACKRSGVEYVSILDNLEAIKSSEQEYYHSVTATAQTNAAASTHWKIVPQFSAEAEFLGTVLIGKRTKLDCDILLRINSIIDYLPGNYWYKNLEGQYFLGSKALIKIMGLTSVNELYGKTDYDMPWAANAEEMRQNDATTIKNDCITICEEHGTTIDGVSRTFFVTKIPLHNEQGSIIGTIGNAIDITEHKKKLKTVQMRLNSIMESIAGNLWWKDINGAYLGCNDAFLSSLEVNSRVDVIGKDDYGFTWAQTADTLLKHDQEVMNLGAPLRKEETLALKSGAVKTFMVMKAPLRNEDGKIIGTVGNGIDITEQKKVGESLFEAKKRAEEANHSKSNFLATISHELRTPLNGILGMAEILGRDNLTDTQKGFVKDIEQSGKNLLSIVNEVLDFSKLAVSKLELKPTTFDLEKLVRDTVANVRHQLEDKDIKLIVDYDGWVPKKIVGDQQRIMQVLANLINNAIKFTEKGYIKVKVTLDDKQNNIASLRFSVEDSGIGIPTDRLDIIFDRFTQGETQQYNKRFNGIGLGLAICKQLIEVMGGNIRVQSQQTKGSIFWFVLPFEVADDGVAQSNFIEGADAIQMITKNRLLLVEDHPINQKVMQTLLTELNFDVDVANSGAEAVDVFKQHDYDLVLMDIGLPDMDGMQVTQKFLNHEKLSHRLHTPVVALTAHALEEDRLNFLNAGMIDVLTKPIAYAQLVDTLKKLIKRR